MPVDSTPSPTPAPQPAGEAGRDRPCIRRDGCLDRNRCSSEIRCCAQEIQDEARDPYAEGVEAHDAGLIETANPFDLESDADRHLSWNDGFSSAVETATDDAMEAGDER